MKISKICLKLFVLIFTPKSAHCVKGGGASIADVNEFYPSRFQNRSASASQMLFN
jgi:hypothetical protein